MTSSRMDGGSGSGDAVVDPLAAFSSPYSICIVSRASKGEMLRLSARRSSVTTPPARSIGLLGGGGDGDGERAGPPRVGTSRIGDWPRAGAGNDGLGPPSSSAESSLKDEAGEGEAETGTGEGPKDARSPSPGLGLRLPPRRLPASASHPRWSAGSRRTCLTFSTCRHVSVADASVCCSISCLRSATAAMDSRTEFPSTPKPCKRRTKSSPFTVKASVGIVAVSVQGCNRFCPSKAHSPYIWPVPMVRSGMFSGRLLPECHRPLRGWLDSAPPRTRPLLLRVA
mmetsp:Transcript_12922/g.42631  ORF Transcript_12922/g.42631 Transcript_12922/m.42631 type:complete len:283 (-) Transcript_12922:555-1403(-)